MCMRTNTLFIVIFTLSENYLKLRQEDFRRLFVVYGRTFCCGSIVFFLFLFFTIGPCSKDLNLQVISFQKIKC